MEDTKFVWNEIHEGITLFWRTSTPENEKKKSKGRPAQVKNEAKIFCPHSYLVLNFQETLTPSEEMRFKKYYMRKVTPMELDVIILQDIKNLVLYLSSKISEEFIRFFKITIVDRFLRALILYFQYYTETWEELMQLKNATEKKAENPLTRGSSLKRADELNCLRCILGKEYSNIIIGSENGARYHHMMAGEKPFIQSKHEKDLRIFETLIAVSHRVVWISLQRKYFQLIEIELHRLFRTDVYNTAERKNNGFQKNIQENEIMELHGTNILAKRKLLRNSPLAYQLVYSECDFRLLALDILNSKDPRIIYLQNALLLNEEKLFESGITVGILGMPRSNFDIYLLRLKDEESEERPSEKILQDEYSPSGKKPKQEKTIPPFGSDLELDLKFLAEPIMRYAKAPKEKKKKLRFVPQ